MFKQFATSLGAGSAGIFRLHPFQLALLLEQAWQNRVHNPGEAIGHPDRRSDIAGLPNALLQTQPGASTNLTTSFRQVRWHHLIYAYLIESTGIYEIFRQVLHEFRHGEKVGVPLPGSEHWLRNTEELFYREPSPFVIYSLTSWVRPDLNASRRNAYLRMFGMSLDEKIVPSREFVKPSAQEINSTFVSTFEEFLREVWIGIKHVTNISGENPTDDTKIKDLAEKLHDMLRSRRLDMEISRQEFFYVSMMSWFHLTLETDTPIVLSLRAEAASPEERLFKIAERIKKPVHALSKQFFDMAEIASLILTQIEFGTYNTSASIPALYLSPIASDMRELITNWSITTGRDLRASKVRSE